MAIRDILIHYQDLLSKTSASEDEARRVTRAQEDTDRANARNQEDSEIAAKRAEILTEINTFLSANP